MTNKTVEALRESNELLQQYRASLVDSHSRVTPEGEKQREKIKDQIERNNAAISLEMADDIDEPVPWSPGAGEISRG